MPNYRRCTPTKSVDRNMISYIPPLIRQPKLVPPPREYELVLVSLKGIQPTGEKASSRLAKGYSPRRREGQHQGKSRILDSVKHGMCESSVVIFAPSLFTVGTKCPVGSDIGYIRL